MKGYNELVKLIDRTNATKGLDTSIEAVCEYQDMIGHSSELQLAALANDESRRRSFYWIYSTAARIEDVLNFYIKHDNKIIDLMQSNEELKENNDELIADYEAERAKALETQRALNEEKAKRIEAENETATLKAEIIELKAKLYDLMSK